MYKVIVLILFPLFLISCGSKEEKVENAIIRANLALTRGDCQSALSILEQEGNQPNNLAFIKSLASAYACKAGYKTTTFFGTDIEKITEPGKILSNFSTFSTSPNDDIENTSYVYLQKALDTLLYAGGISKSSNPTAATRDLLFGSKGKEINSFALYLTLAQLGKFSYYFGNSDPSTGEKGAGGITSNNLCYLNYNANVDNFITALNSDPSYDTGSCNSGLDSGHPDLVTGSDTVNVANACVGVVLFNNFLDTLSNFLATFTGDDFSDFEGLPALIDDLKTEINDAKPGFDIDIFNTTSQSRCESDFAGNDEDIMIFYVAIFETLHR